VPRGQWDHSPALAYVGREQQVRRIIIHHDAVEYRNGQGGEEKVAALLRSSRDEQGWPDVPYHYLIDRDGRVFVGRPEHLVCETHTRYDASETLHIALLGNYSHLEPTGVQIEALIELVREKARQYGIPADAIKLHGDVVATDCPGRHLRDRLAATPGW
jgi:hypothetical protein